MRKFLDLLNILPLRHFRALPGWAAILSLGALGLTPKSGFASYERPVNWANEVTADLSSALKPLYSSEGNLYHPAHSESDLEIALNDRDSLIDDQFSIPSQMRNVVEFWFRVYTEFTTQHVVIYDSKHPEIIYDVLDFRDLARTSKSRMAYEIVRERRIDRAVRDYRRAFAQLAKKRRPKRPTEIQQKILAGLKKSKHRHSMRDFSENLRFQTGQRDSVIRGLQASSPYFPQMEKIFTEMGLPVELTRISLVESSFNLNAVSRVGATGVWQFMPKSALEYMVIDKKRGIDERLSPLKSTVAAAKLLKRSKRMLKTWPLAITSYNHGYRGLIKISKNAWLRKPHRAFSLCRGSKSSSPVGWASSNYYAEFLALLHAERYRHLFYGEVPISVHAPVKFVKLTKEREPVAIALEYGVSLHDLRLLNPDIMRLKTKLPRGFRVALPGRNDDLAQAVRGWSPDRLISTNVN